MVIYVAARRSDENIGDISWGQVEVMKIVLQVEVIKILVIYDGVKKMWWNIDDEVKKT